MSNREEKELRIRLVPEKEVLFFQCLRQLTEQTSLYRMEEYLQHGKTDCLFHSYAVAYYSLYVCSLLGIRCEETLLIRGALLHDYFLYDWHIKDPSHRWHGFHHGKRAYLNARRELTLTKKEADIIKHHMFPLTPCPPLCREALIVCIVDKICSIYELRKVKRYRSLYRLWKQNSMNKIKANASS